MMKKLFCTVFAVFAVMTAAGAVGNIFPASRTDIDGVTRSGYLDEDGRTVLSFSYATAGDFAPCGLAAVEDDKWQTAVIDREGKLVIDYTESPVSVDFSDDMVAYRYADHSVYYTLSGTKIGSYPGAEGFFEDGLLLCQGRLDRPLLLRQAGRHGGVFRVLCRSRRVFGRPCARAQRGQRLSRARH